MRYVMVEHAGQERPGVLDGDSVSLLSAPDLTAVITAPVSIVDKIPYSAGILRPPLRRFRRDILCTGWNYWDHFEESRGKRVGQDVDPQEVRLQCLVNGEVRQDASTKQMAFDVATLISELSFGMTLRPGDLLLTGTPAGIGNAREPQVFLQDGDVVITRADKIGELRNKVAKA